jgi:3-dehydroquinate dehydratase-2
MKNGQKFVLVINGPNPNLLGIREPHIYGHETLKDVEEMGAIQAKNLKAEVEFFQRSVVFYAPESSTLMTMVATGKAR